MLLLNHFNFCRVGIQLCTPFERGPYLRIRLVPIVFFPVLYWHRLAWRRGAGGQDLLSPVHVFACVLRVNLGSKLRQILMDRPRQALDQVAPINTLVVVGVQHDHFFGLRRHVLCSASQLPTIYCLQFRRRLDRMVNPLLLLQLLYLQDDELVLTRQRLNHGLHLVELLLPFSSF